MHHTVIKNFKKGSISYSFDFQGSVLVDQLELLSVVRLEEHLLDWLRKRLSTLFHRKTSPNRKKQLELKKALLVSIRVTYTVSGVAPL